MNIEQVFLESVGESIVAIRKAMGIPQNKFAEAMQVTVQTQAAYESGKREPTLVYLARMSTYTGHSIASILGEPLQFHNYADIIKCISTLDDIGVLKVRAIQLDGKEDLCFDNTVVQYLDALEALRGDSDDPSRAEANLLNFYKEKSAPPAGSGFDPSGAAICPFANVKEMTVHFGYIKDNPVIVRELNIEGKAHYNILTPDEKGSGTFSPALNIPVGKLDIKALTVLIPEKLHEFYDFIPAKTGDFSLSGCRAWEIDLPCLGSRTMVISAFDRNNAPMTIILGTLAKPEVEYFSCFLITDPKGNKKCVTGEHDFFFNYLTRIYSPCRSEGKARQLAWKYGVVAEHIFLGGPEPNERECEHCNSGDGGAGYKRDEIDRLEAEAEAAMESGSAEKLLW